MAGSRPRQRYRILNSLPWQWPEEVCRVLFVVATHEAGVLLKFLHDYVGLGVKIQLG